MILVVSTSSPMASVAWFDEQGALLAADQREANRAASQAVYEMVEQHLGITDVSHFVADLGPGSFTGIRVGIAMVKAWAWAKNAQSGGIVSLDLLEDPLGAVMIRKGEWVRRSPSGELESFSDSVPSHTDLPMAARAAQHLDCIHWMSAFDLMPVYGGEPSISTPKTRMGGAAHG